MKKGKLISRIFGIALVGLMIAAMLGGLPALVNKVKASPGTIYVPDNYPTIQAAVNASSPGDTIIVRDGTYIESVDVYKDHLSIRSENGMNLTIIQAANSKDHVFEVTADYVSINGFTVEGALGSASPGWKAGIYLNHTSYNNISNNNGLGNHFGIWLYYSNNAIVVNNNLLDNGDGIVLYYSENDTLQDNVAATSHAYPEYSIGIELAWSCNNTLINNKLSSLDYGIWFFKSNGNIVTSNYLSFNNFGIDLHNDSENILIQNNIVNNKNYGVVLTQWSTSNKLIGNNISNNGCGIFCSDTFSNEVYLNDVNNGDNAHFIANTTNIWDSPEEITYTYNGNTFSNYLGNYWSDYTGGDADGDGIGDTPYPVESDVDNYPLVQPPGNYEIGVTVDTTPPNVCIVFPEDGATNVSSGTSITATFSEAMNSSTINTESFTVAGSAIPGTVTYNPVTYTATFTSGVPLDCNHTYTATLSTNITDEAGNPLVAPYSWSFTTESTLEVDFSAQPTHGYAPLAVQFTDVSTGLSTSWEWDFNGDGIVDTTEQNPIHEYESGTYTVSLTAHGPDGSNIRTKTDYIVAESPTSSQIPAATFVYAPSAPKAGEEVTLNASASSDSDGHIEYYEWDLDGDGDYDGFTTSPTIYYRWTSSGTYHISLRVCDNDGAKATHAEDIQVTERSLWEKAKSLFSSSVKSLSKDDWDRFEFIKSELHISNWPHSDKPWSDPDFYWIDDNELLTVLNEEIDPTLSPLTYETYIVDQLHDMELADSVAAHPFSVDPMISAYFDNMAEVNVWVEWTSMMAKEALTGLIEVKGGSGIGIDAVLMLWDLAQAKVGLDLLDQTFYKRALWFYFDNRDSMSPQEAFDSSPVSLKYRNQATRNYFEKLWTEYGGSNIAVGGGLKDEFKNQIIEQLRNLLLAGFQEYKFAPYQIYQAKSPGELRVYDSSGRVTGVINNIVREEIPNSAYDDETETVLIYPVSGVYYCQFVGTGDGMYGLTLMDIQEGEPATVNATQVATASGTIHEYAVDWNAISQGRKGITVYVDSNGDGHTDYTVTGGSVLTGADFVPPTSGCFIATATYGTPMAPEIQTLRTFRDQYLLTNPLGQAFVDFYYKISPPIAEFIIDHPSLKPLVRTALVPAVVMSTVAVSTTPIEKMAIVGLLVLISVAVVIWTTRRRKRGPEYS